MYSNIFNISLNMLDVYISRFNSVIRKYTSIIMWLNKTIGRVKLLEYLAKRKQLI